MRLTTRLRHIEAKLRPPDAARRFIHVIEAEDGSWRDGGGNLIDPATVTGPVRVIRLVPQVPGGPCDGFPGGMPD